MVLVLDCWRVSNAGVSKLTSCPRMVASWTVTSHRADPAYSHCSRRRFQHVDLPMPSLRTHAPPRSAPYPTHTQQPLPDPPHTQHTPSVRDSPSQIRPIPSTHPAAPPRSAPYPAHTHCPGQPLPDPRHTQHTPGVRAGPVPSLQLSVFPRTALRLVRHVRGTQPVISLQPLGPAG